MAMLAVTIISAQGQDTPQQQMEPLIATTFDGWKQLGGKATYAIEDGVVIGTSVPNTPNSFMTTEKRYGDFVLYRPPVKSTTWLLWGGPFLLLILGLVFLAAKLRSRATQESPQLSEAEHRQAADLLGQNEGKGS